MTRVCECHGVPMLFGKDRRYREGGFWRCKVKHREGVARIRATSLSYRVADNFNQRRRRQNARPPRRPDPRIATFLLSVKTGRTHGQIPLEG